ncbi:hypothetical protein RCIP0102_00138 [Klebsiella phage RCIP0102]|jgi:hypothetical protein|uniref:Uncharacterized protein n=2 Tax=Viruses TaxID=10239 RepID=A0A2K9V5E4_9CAUD|nr:hypothetical protein KP1_25 [Klebsiella phage KP1]QQM14491.1 hypothetical protein [Klebsiella phage vB_KpnM_17-11]UWI30089.1 MAG: hypothetical protein [Bacteriophage sp.]WKW87624.1 hypothetical protein pzkkv4_212 [Klebsiella phage pzk-kv4]WKW88716.1 hypothetical protein pzkkv61_143 [Klebsiella phage pzk-kv6-1]
MTDQEFYDKLKNIRIPAPEWFSLPIDEQIQYQVKETLEKYPDRKVMMCFTYDKNRVPRIQKQVIEV